MKLLERGPLVAVPAAWGVTALSLSSLVDGMTFIPPMLVVMLAAQLFFLVKGWGEMDSGALGGWRLVILLGIPFTLCGLLGLYWHKPFITLLSIAYWLKAPGLGMAYTWEMGGGRIYVALGLITVVSGCLFDTLTLVDLPSLPFLLAAGAAQTAGIMAAVKQNT